jgi:hypothetical protein
MKSKLILSGILLFILLISESIAFQPGKLPFGIQNLNGVSDTTIINLRDDLGFNMAWMCGGGNGLTSLSEIQRVHNLGFDVIPYMMDSSHPDAELAFRTYLNGYYMVTEAEDNTSQIRFLQQNGHVDPQDTNWYVAPKASIPYTLLDDLWYDQEDSLYSQRINYKPFIHMKMYPDTSINEDTTIIAWLNIWASHDDWWSWSGCDSNFIPPIWGHTTRHGGRFYRQPIRKSMFLVNNPDTIQLEPFFVPHFWVDTIYFENEDPHYDTTYLDPIVRYPSGGSPILTYQIEVVGCCSLAVDWLKVYNDNGLSIIRGDFDPVFSQYVAETNPATLWQLRDDMRTNQMMLAGHLEDIISQNSQKHGMMKLYEGFIVSPKDLVKIAHPEYFWIDRYILYGGCQWDTCALGGSNTLYYGTTYDYANGDYGLQSLVNQYIVDILDSIKVAIGDSVKLFYIPQIQIQKYVDCPYEIYRRSTDSELRMQVAMALSYKVDGIQFWPYDSEGDLYSRGARVFYGLTDTTGNVYPEVWNQIRDVSKYVQAFDEYLTDSHMIWVQSYTSHQMERSNYLYSIHGWSDSPNPDTGWAQIGEFYNNSSGEKYIMIVNRACSSDDQGTEAPPQHFTLKFNPSALNLTDYVNFTDIADSMRYAGPDTGWVGVPHITYSTNMTGSYIPYTVTLKAGEGKLIKITAADDTISWLGTPNLAYTYQGEIYILGDVNVPSGQTLRVKAPANFIVSNRDSLATGISSRLVEIIANGKLDFRGSDSDSITFAHLMVDISGNWSEIANPDPGDWYGIRDRSSDYDTLTYCSIKYAYNGFRADTNSNALIRHCELANASNNGVYLNFTSTSSVIIDSSYIHGCGAAGIYDYASLLTARDNTIYDVDTYGIYYNKKGGVSLSDIYLTNNHIWQGPGSGTNGIKIEGSVGDVSDPKVILNGNWAKGFSQSGIYLNYCGHIHDIELTGSNIADSNSYYGLYCRYSSPSISGNDDCAQYNSFSFNGIYGLYCVYSSSPKVRNSFFVNNQANLNCASSSLPNLGDGTFWGENVFLLPENSNWDDIKNNLIPLQAISAQGNYWGEYPPDTLEFYPNKTAVNYKSARNLNPCDEPTLFRYDNENAIPSTYSLYQNYPNPFNPSTTIAFDLPEDSWVRLSLYNVLGQRVRTVANSQYSAGSHQVIWDGRNESGGEVSSGVYFYLLETNSFRDAKKMLMIR